MMRPLLFNNPAEAILAPAEPLTGTVAVYAPAMCCPTGRCGPGVLRSAAAPGRGDITP